MPSLAQGIGRGLSTGANILSFLKAQERQRLEDERTSLLNEVTRESLADIKRARKLHERLLFQEGMKGIAEQHQRAVGGYNLGNILRTGGATPSQTELAQDYYYQTGKYPTQAFDWVTPKEPKEPKTYEVDRDIGALTDLILGRQPEIGPSIPRFMAREQATQEVYEKKYPGAFEKAESKKGLTYEEASSILTDLRENRKYLLTEQKDMNLDSPEIKEIDAQIKTVQQRLNQLRAEKLGGGKKVRVTRGGSSGVTKEEDEFIAEARGREDQINWEKVASKYPKWNIFYIKQKLGVNE